MIDLKSPSVILINEKRMLQEAVDALIDNGRRSKPVTGAGNRPLKSLSSSLKVNLVDLDKIFLVNVLISLDVQLSLLVLH